MRDHLTGWYPISQIAIPPIEKRGFDGMVLIRPTTQQVSLEKRVVPCRAYVCRMKTNERVEITKAVFVIGKGSKADYIVEGNSAISRTHAKIALRDGHYYLEDLDSSNHTFIDESMLQGEVPLADGMTFRLADETFRFEIEGGQGHA